MQAVVEEQAMVRGFLLWKLSAQHNLSFFLFSENVDAEQHEFQLAAAAASNAAYKAQVLAQIELNEPGLNPIPAKPNPDYVSHRWSSDLLAASMMPLLFNYLKPII